MLSISTPFVGMLNSFRNSDHAIAKLTQKIIVSYLTTHLSTSLTPQNPQVPFLIFITMKSHDDTYYVFLILENDPVAEK